jgi:hypothetical protein
MVTEVDHPVGIVDHAAAPALRRAQIVIFTAVRVATFVSRLGLAWWAGNRSV